MPSYAVNKCYVLTDFIPGMILSDHLGDALDYDLQFDRKDAIFLLIIPDLKTNFKFLSKS